jgi:hypothetical protein
MTENQEPAFERFFDDGPLDETDVALRAYFARLTDEHLKEYNPAWPDDRVVEWDGNFRSDGALMLTCCERRGRGGISPGSREAHRLRKVIASGNRPQ